MLKYLQRQTDIVFVKKKMQMDGIGWYEYFRYPYTGGVL